MNSYIPFSEMAWVEALGWTLFHSLWQGALIAGLLVLAFTLGRVRNAQTRYISSLLALSVLMGWTVLTFWQAYQQAGTPTPWEVTIYEEMPMEIAPVDQSHISPPAQPWYLTWLGHLDQSAPWIAALWLIGMLLFLLRWVAGLWHVQTLRYRDARILPYQWQHQVNALAHKMGLSRTVLLIESERIASPFTMGHFKPVILVPVGLLTGLAPDQVEALLAHELAHIRRYDYLLNLWVSFLEVLFFFHPAVWWMSQLTRQEREHCCDDLAVATCGDPKGYARTLAALAAHAMPKANLVPGFAGPRKQLLFRIKRLFIPHLMPENRNKALVAGLLLACLSVLGAILPRPAQAENPTSDSVVLNGPIGAGIPWFFHPRPDDTEEVPASPASEGDVTAIAAPVSNTWAISSVAPIAPLDMGWVMPVCVDTPPPPPPVAPVPPVPPVPAVPPAPPAPPVPPLPDSLGEEWTAYMQDMEAWQKSWNTEFAETWEAYGKDMEKWGEAFAASWADYEANMDHIDVDWDNATHIHIEGEIADAMEIAQESMEMKLDALRDAREAMEDLEGERFRQAEEQLRREEERLRRERERMEQETERRLRSANRQVEMEAAQMARIEAQEARMEAMTARMEAQMEAQEARMEAKQEASMVIMEARKDKFKKGEKKLRTALQEDGYLKDTDDPISIRSKNGSIKINGNKIEGATYQKYKGLLKEMGIEIGSGNQVSVSIK